MANKRRSKATRSTPSRARHSPTTKRSWVKVPVLSNTTAVTRDKASKACRRRTNTPPCARAPADDSIAAGVAKDKAQGQVTMSTATATDKACVWSMGHQYSAAPAAANMTKTKKGAAMRSAKMAKRGLSMDAFSIRLTICPKRVSLPNTLKRTNTGPPMLKLPATTDSPRSFETGSDSPVSKASSTEALSLSSSASPANTWPAGTRTTSPTTKRRVDTVLKEPSACC